MRNIAIPEYSMSSRIHARQVVFDQGSDQPKQPVEVMAFEQLPVPGIRYRVEKFD